VTVNPKTLPVPTPETRHYWDGAKMGELRLQQCDDCQHIYFPPRPFCPECASRGVSVINASGKGILYSYVINHRLPKWREEPYAIAIVELAEGPRMMTNIVGVPQTPEMLILDMPVEVVFESVSDEITLPKFQPIEEGV
jgi:uncharacterized protein